MSTFLPEMTLFDPKVVSQYPGTRSVLGGRLGGIPAESGILSSGALYRVSAVRRPGTHARAHLVQRTGHCLQNTEEMRVR